MTKNEFRSVVQDIRSNVSDVVGVTNPLSGQIRQFDPVLADLVNGVEKGQKAIYDYLITRTENVAT